MINWFKIFRPWKRIKELEEQIVDFQDTIKDHKNWCEASEFDKLRLKGDCDELQKKNHELMAEVSTFKATLREFQKLCERYL